MEQNNKRELEEKIGYSFRRQELLKSGVDAQFLYKRETLAEI